METNPTPVQPPEPTPTPQQAPESGSEPELIPLETLGEAQPKPGQPETGSPAPAKWEPFSSGEIAVFVGLLGMAAVRPKSFEDVAVFGSKFHGQIGIQVPEAGVNFQTSVAEAFEHIKLGEALAAFGIRKPAGWAGNIGELPPIMRVVVGVAIAGYATYGGIRAVNEFRQAQQTASSNPPRNNAAGVGVPTEAN